MGRIDNDATKGLAVPFLILAHVRTGGTFAAHALSNHPQVYCDRGETLHHLSAWRKARIPLKRILPVIWSQDGYHAAGFRAIYPQAFHEKVWPLVLRWTPRIIHLTRKNITRQGVSQGYQQLVRAEKIPFHPVHSFEERTPEPVEAKPETIVWWAKKVRREVEAATGRLAGYPGRILAITYEDMVDNGRACWMAPEISDRIADFLGVRRVILPVDLKCDFPMPMSEWFSNWDAVRAALAAAEFGDLDG